MEEEEFKERERMHHPSGRVGLHAAGAASHNGGLEASDPVDTLYVTVCFLSTLELVFIIFMFQTAPMGCCQV